MSTAQSPIWSALSGLLLLASQAHAAPPRGTPAGAASSTGAWAVILASTTQRTETEAQLQAMGVARAFELLKPADGFPKILESSSWPGLQPGLHVVVLGVCGSQREALAAQVRVRPELSDAYVKKLTHPQTLACPQPLDRKLKLPRGAERLASFPFEGTPGLTLDIYRGRVRSQLECTTSDLILRLVHEGRALSEATVEGSCQGACTPQEKREGEKEVAELRKAIARGEATDSSLDDNFTACQTFEPRFELALSGLGNPILVVSTPEAAPHGSTRSPVRIAGVGCGGVVVSKAFMGAQAFAAGWLDPQPGRSELLLRAQPDTPGPPGWKRFSLFGPSTESTTSEATTEWFAHVEWLAERCEWKIAEVQ